MSLSLESLKEQLVASEAELEQAKSHVYRCDGAIQILRYQISLLEQEALDDESNDKPAES